MQPRYNWQWIEAQTAQAIEVWHDSVSPRLGAGPRFTRSEQRLREKAYDEGMRAVEREVRRTPRSQPERIATQERITAAFARFAATALGLEAEAVHLLTHDFLPVGTQLGRWARRFDPDLGRADILQACRNAWTACGLQPLLGDRPELTPSILGYSLLYPYSDNYLDRTDVSRETKLRFSERFRDRLRGEALAVLDQREAAIWALVQLIEEQYPRMLYPLVFDSLLAIHRAQEESLAQLRSGSRCSDADLLRLTCAKGGSSLLADACLAHGSLTQEESRFSFEWGLLLQLGDDLQDVHEDLQRGSVTLFSRAAALGTPLDGLTRQLLCFSERVGARMDNLPHGTMTLKSLMKMSWRSLILGAVANAREFFSPGFFEEAECRSQFRFKFLRSRQKRSMRRQGLYASVFDALVEGPAEEDLETSLPDYRLASLLEEDVESAALSAAV
jgi:hypothetical protein